jgi:hypothetical protein
MAQKRSRKLRRTPLEEALDENTDPERLRKLVRHEDQAVKRAALSNPAVPEDIWREKLLGLHPMAWNNPMAPFYLLTWVEPEDEYASIKNAARKVVPWVLMHPDLASQQAKQLISAKVIEWWQTSKDAPKMMLYLEKFYLGNENDVEHRQLVKLAMLCVSTVTYLSQDDVAALHLLEEWVQGKEDSRHRALALAKDKLVKRCIENAFDPDAPVADLIGDVSSDMARATVSESEFFETSAKHDEVLADVIRGAMPVPPVLA